MKNPLVTIITPTYNQQEYIGKCIESVLSQTFPKWEMIIVDDGSIDKTPDIIKKYCDDRIIYLREGHRGLEGLDESYNLALAKARGQFVAILEGDDKWPEDKLENQVLIFKDKDVVLSWGIGILIDKHDKIIGRISTPNYNNKHFYNKPPGMAINRLIFGNFVTPTVTVMVRKDSLLDVGGFHKPQHSFYVDLSTWLELSLKGEFRHLPMIMGYWRRYDLQTTVQKYAEIQRSHNVIISNFMARYDNGNKVRVNEFPNRAFVSSSYSWHEGLSLSKETKWLDARKEFLRVIHNAPLIVKIRASISYILSYFHIHWTEFENKLNKR